MFLLRIEKQRLSTFFEQENSDKTYVPKKKKKIL